MDLSLSSAISWIRNEQTGGEAPKVDDAEAQKAMKATQAMLAASLEGINEVVAKATLSDRASADARKQALYDTVYLVAAADGSISPQEHAKLSIGLQGLLGEGFDASAVDDGLDMARVLKDERGLAGAAAAIAETITEEFERNALTLIASTVAWLGGGVGTKEGLALQAIAKAFGIPTKLLHEIMASAHAAAKA